MSIQAQQVIERTPGVCLGAAFSVFMIGGTFALLVGLAAAGVGLVEW